MTIKKLKDSLESRKFEESILGGPLTFGAAVEAMRVANEFSQVDFAKKLGVSRQYLCDVEKGRRFVSPEQAVRFAQAFQHPPVVFVQLAIQDLIRSAGLKYKVLLEDAA
jgi:transcriptional regulator with XRE-family HTH domain